MMEKSPAQTKVVNSTPTVTPGALPESPGALPESPGLAPLPTHCSDCFEANPWLPLILSPPLNMCL